ncbi:universal stress protein [Levilactobacillus bambusae]|uniref:Universal stress protein n=1 Tax=Levilactobacillus bambusae TaxID=2024736 RepID=A0A2V1N0L5_9LACO|nr:universal stress protein [Levilactobacillus bambusae]PWG00777.1 universal stress protein [Levilactobacillus bambusae]
MYKRILVPLDGSHNAELALKDGIALASKFSAKLFLLAVADTPRIVAYGVGLGPKSNLFDDVTDRAQNLLDAAQKQAAQSGVDAKTILRDGNPKSVIAHDVPEEEKIDLIMIGKSGRDALERFLVGSTTDYVVRHAKCDIQIIRDRD